MEELSPEYLIAKQQFLVDMDRLKEEDVVKSFEMQFDRVKIKFWDGLSEIYDRKMLESVDRYVRDIPIGYQHTINPLDNESEELKRLFSISAKDFNRGGFLDKELCIHRIARRLSEEMFSPRKYPYKLLKADYISIDKSVFMRDNKVVMYPRHKRRYRGRFVQENFYDFSDDLSHKNKSIRIMWGDPKVICKIARWLLSRNKNFNYTNFIRKLIASADRTKSARRVRSVGLYLALFDYMGVKEYGWIHDKDPVWWSKAIACSKLKCRYTFENERFKETSSKFNNFIDSIGEVGNTEYSNLENGKADILMLDYNLDEYVDANLDKHTKHIGSKWDKIVYISREPTKDYVEIEPIEFMRYKLYFNIIS